MIECTQNLNWKGDGVCDDDLNNQACGFDGGDCCLENVNLSFCTDCLCLENEQTTPATTSTTTAFTTNNYPGEYYLYCLSFYPHMYKTSIVSNNQTLDCPTEHQSWIGDGYCDDVTNTEVCNYDGGDCCLENVVVDYCIECLCLDSGSVNTTDATLFTIIPTWPSTTTSGETTTSEASCEEGWIGDGMCDDINNNGPCLFDGGDCCLEVVVTDFCIDCLCLDDSSSGSSGVTTETPTGNLT